MVNLFAVFLLFVKLVWELVVADKVVNDGLEYDVEIIGKQKLVELSIYLDLSRLVKECKAQFPKLKSLVRKVLVFYLP